MSTNFGATLIRLVPCPRGTTPSGVAGQGPRRQPVAGVDLVPVGSGTGRQVLSNHRIHLRVLLNRPDAGAFQGVVIDNDCRIRTVPPVDIDSVQDGMRVLARVRFLLGGPCSEFDSVSEARIFSDETSKKTVLGIHPAGSYVDAYRPAVRECEHGSRGGQPSRGERSRGGTTR